MYIFVEGNSDKTFLQPLLKYNNIPAAIKVTDGKDNLVNMPQLQKYSNPVIIFDADNDCNSTKNNIINQIKNINKEINNLAGFNKKSQIFAYLEAFGYKHINYNKDIDYTKIFDFNHKKIVKLINFLKNI